jgi:hypothetical protein
MENFVIIPAHEWDETQERLRARATREKGQTKNATHGKLLLSGLVFCGACGAKMTNFGQKSIYKRKDGTVSKKKHYKYLCSSNVYPTSEKCDGQSTFSAVKLENAVVADIKRFLSTLNHKELISEYLRKIDEEAQGLVLDFNAKSGVLQRAESELQKLKEEILKALMGTSAFTETMIKELLVKKEYEVKDLQAAVEATQNEILRIDAEKASYMELDGGLSDWCEKFDKQPYEQQKIMILSVVDRVIVFRDKIEIIYDIKLQSFRPELDKGEEIDYNRIQENVCMLSETPTQTDLFLPQNFGGYGSYQVA